MTLFFRRIGLGFLVAIGILSLGALNDRGLLSLRNILDVGRPVVPVSAPGFASQGSCVMPTTGTVSGLTLVGDINTCFAAILTANSGGSAPANGTGGAAMTGQLWLDTSTTPNGVKMYDGTSWNLIGYQDASGNVWTPPVGGGTNTILSATTTDLWSVRQAYVSVTGTTPITALASASAVAGTVKVIRFTGALTLTYNATSLILPTAASITTAAGDSAVVLALTSTNVVIIAYTRADGTALNVSAAFAGAVSLTGIISPTALSGTTNDWAPTGLSTANLIRASASSAAIVTGMTAQGSGRVLLLHNVGSFAITFTNAGAGSSAANRFTLSRDLTLQPNDSIAVVYDNTTSRWRPWQTIQKVTTIQKFTSGAAATYTPATGVAYIKVRMVGGGGGGAAVATNNGANGGDTSFGSWTAIHGNGGLAAADSAHSVGGTGGTGGVDGTGTLVVRFDGQDGQPPSGESASIRGGDGGQSVFGGGGRGAYSSAAGSAAKANTGSGGGGGAAANDRADGGGAGEYVEFLVSAPTATTYTVGAGGAGGAAGTMAGGNAAAGIIIIEEFY